VRTLENLPDLKKLRLNNNRWTCSCDVVELMQWASKRREHQTGYRPIKCLEGGKYRTLWTAASGGKSCNESTIPTPPVTAGIAASRVASETTTTDVAASLGANETTTDVAASLAANETTTDVAASLAANETTTDVAASLAANETTTDVAASLAANETTTNITAKLTRLVPYLSLQVAKETAVTGGDEHTAIPEIETGGSGGLFSRNANTILFSVILLFTLGVAVLALRAFYCTNRTHSYDTYHIYEEID
jgi:hypothetical protein